MNSPEKGDRPSPGRRHRRRRLAGTAAAAVFGLVIICAPGVTGPIFERTSLIWTIWWLPPAILLVLYGRSLGPQPGRRRIPGPVAALMLMLVLGLLSSTIPAAWWFYFLRWLPEGEPFRSTLVRFILVSALLTPLFAWRRWPRRATGWLLSAAAVWMVVLAAHRALQTLEGGVLYRTDHPSFMFRLWEFGQTFPALGGYNPWWNGGIEHFAGVTSGVQGLGLLIYPLLRAAPVHTYYNTVIIALFIFLNPIIAAISVRAVGGRKEAMAAGALLSLGVSRHFFLWMWHFGTVGASLSSLMVVPTIALAYRAAVRHRLGAATFFGLAASAFLMTMWAPLGVIVGLGLTVSFLGARRHWSRPSFLFLLAAAGLVLLAYLPWLRIILFPARAVVDYVGQGAGGPAPVGAALLGGARRLGKYLLEGHPVLVFLGLGGAIAAAPGTIRRWYLPPLLLLAAVCGWALEWKPLSQLDRAAIPLMFAALVPAALCAGRVLRSAGWRSAPARAVLFALLVLGGYNVSQLYANRGIATAQTIDPMVNELIEWVRGEVPENGRLLFAGRAVHYYGGGNIAYLPVMAGREMMADDYYGFPPRTIEYNYPPPRYRRDGNSFLGFAAAYNVTHVITRHDDYREFFALYPEIFEPARTFSCQGRELTAYRLLRDHPLLPAAGRVRAEINRLVIEFDGEPQDVILPYNWRDGLVCRTPGAAIEPYRYDKYIRLIAVRPGGERRVTIGYRAPWGPVKPNFDGRFHH